MSQNLNRFFRIYLRLAALTLVVCTLLRIVLLFNEQTSELGFGFLQWVAVFGLGALNDLCALTLGYVFLWLFLLTLSKRKYDRPTGYVLLGVLTAAFCYVAFCNTIFDEYGSAAPLVATIVLGYWAGSFALRLFVPRLQPLWSKGWLAALLAIYVGAILFNAVSEYYFWNEFGVRYNFIAVDYLVYTNEVVGNIMESYPIVPLATLIVALTGGNSSPRRSIWPWRASPCGCCPSTRGSRRATTYTTTNCRPTDSISSTRRSSKTNSTTCNSTARCPKTGPRHSSTTNTGAKGRITVTSPRRTRNGTPTSCS